MIAGVDAGNILEVYVHRGGLWIPGYPKSTSDTVNPRYLDKIPSTLVPGCTPSTLRPQRSQCAGSSNLNMRLLSLHSTAYRYSA